MRSRYEMRVLRQALYEEAKAAQPTTVRHLFYRLVARGVVAKTQAAYDGTVVKLYAEMRESGRIPWEWIVDETRWERRPQSFTSMEKAIENCYKTYRRDALAECRDYVAIYCEKNALAGILFSVTEKYDVPLLVTVGYSSIGFLHDHAKKIVEECQGKRIYIYQIGDDDKSGWEIWEQIRTSIPRYPSGFLLKDYPQVHPEERAGMIDKVNAMTRNIHFERLALTKKQVIEYKLPTRPPKIVKGRVIDSSTATEVDAMDT